MSYELQLSSAIFGLIVRRRLTSAVHPCLDEQISTPLGDLVIDRVVIAPETSIQQERALDPATLQEVSASTQNAAIFSPTNYTSITVPFLQVKQAIDIMLVSPQALVASGDEPTAPALTIRVHVVLNVSAHVANQTQGGSDNVTLAYQLAYLDPGSARPFVTHAQLQTLRNMLAGFVLPSTTVNLAQLAGLAGDGADARFVNAAIACDPGGTRIALRLEADVYRSPVKIGSAFFTAGPQDHLEGNDWAFLVDEDVIVTNVAATARDALQGQANVRLRSGPFVSWSPGTTSVVTTARIEAIDACPFFVDDIDMDVNVRINVGFAVPAEDQLRTTFNINGSPANFGEVLGCAVTAGLLWPFIGPILLSREEDPLKAFATYFVGMVLPPLVRVAAVIFAIETKTLSQDISDDLGDNCQKINDETYVCTENLDLLIPIFGAAVSRLRVNQVVGRAAGLVLRGTIRRPVEPAATLAEVTASDLAWTITGGCKRGFSIVNQAQIEVGGEGHHICRWRLLSDDPLGAYAVTLHGDQLEIRTQFTPAFLANPYGCQFRIVTSAGVRTITYPAPGPITDAEREHLDRLRANFVGVCRKIADAITERQVVNWGRDDPIDQIDKLRLWEIAVLGLPPEARLVLREARGAEIVDAVASRSGVIHMMNAFAGRDKPQAVLLESEAAVGQDVTITQRQTVYRRVASLPVTAAPSSIGLEMAAGGPRLSILDGPTRTLWDVASPQAPALLEWTSDVGTNAADSDFDGDDAVLSGRMRIARDIAVPRLGGMRDAVVAREDGRTLLLDRSAPERPRVAQRYPGTAWFESVAASGRLLARYDAERSAVDLFAIEASDGDFELYREEAER